MPLGRVIHIYAIVKKYKAFPLYLPECKNTIAAGTCQFNKEMFGGKQGTVKYSCQVKATLLFPGPHQAAGGPGRGLCLLTKTLKLYTVECQESFAPILEQEKNRMRCQIGLICQNTSDNTDSQRMLTVLNALPVLFHLIPKAILWGQYSYYLYLQRRKQL